MFGYIRPYKAALSENQQKAFNSVYCGFCRALGSSGALLRFTLSYDLTFYCLLALSLSDEKIVHGKCRCPVKCSGRSCVMPCDSLYRAADLAVLLLYGKLCDNINDKDSSLLSKLALMYVKPKYKKASEKLSEENALLENYLKAQATAESEGASLDRCADPTATLLSHFFSKLAKNDEEKEILSRLGYVLGRWIYILDAADDLESDIKKNRFNPLIQKNTYTKEEISQIKKDCEFSLNISISEAQDAFVRLDLKNFKSIIENIIFLGLKNSQDICFRYKSKKERKKAYSGKSL